MRRVGELVFSENVFRGPLRLPEHAHERASLGVALHGSYTVEARGSRVEATAPMVAYFPAGVKRAVTFGPGTTLVLWIELPDTLSARLGAPRGGPLGFLPVGSGRPEWLAHRLLAELRRDDEASALLLEGRVLELVGTLARSLHGDRPRAPAWLGPALRRLEDSSGGVRLARLAAACGLHPSHLARAFKAHMGCSVGDYARRARAARARSLLSCSSLSLAELAHECGYADQAHLSREFRRHYGTTPLAFRRGTGSRKPGARPSHGDKTHALRPDTNPPVRRSL